MGMAKRRPNSEIEQIMSQIDDAGDSLITIWNALQNEKYKTYEEIYMVVFPLQLSRKKF